MNTENLKVWDTIIVGAGAAGLMTAIQARRKGLEVLLIDGREKIGAKILMSGGTRCNITNQNVKERDFQSGQKKIVASILKSFTSEQALAFFKEIGVLVVLEPGGKYFPSTHSGKTVLDALVKETEKQGVVLVTGKKVQKAVFENGMYSVQGPGLEAFGRTLVLTTGGLSFPTTGSDGSGYTIAESFGHKLVDRTPALTPLTTGDTDWKSLSGVTLPVRLSISIEGKKTAACEGSFLFTHVGFSGPAALDVSRHWLRAPQGQEVKLSACFLPHLPEEKFRAGFLEAIQNQPAKTVKKYISEFLPERFVEVLLGKLKISDAPLNQLKREARELLIRSLQSFPLHVNGSLGYAKAEVTAGGVDLAEVERLTLESKRQPGLFFAGEILDVDGRIGGFNFQWAWSSGVIAAQGAAKRIQGFK